MTVWSQQLPVGLFPALLMAGPLMAQALREVDAYMEDLCQRIDRGVRNGKLTGREASKLKGVFGRVETARGRFQDMAAGHPALDALVLDAVPTRMFAQTLLPLRVARCHARLRRARRRPPT